MGLNVEELINEKKDAWKLELLAGKRGLKNQLNVADINRCGIALTGYFEHFAWERIQVFGETEVSYLQKMENKKRSDVLAKMFKHKIPMMIICRGLIAAKEIVDWGNSRNIPIVKTPLYTTRFISEATNYLEEKLAPKVKTHGVLVDVYGVGVLLLGKSGIGKSECALELIKRGHRLVADDVVEIVRISEDTLYGYPQKLLKYFLEVRGLGIVNVKDLFGVGATRDRKRIEMTILLEDWNEKKYYERAGFQEKFLNIMGVKIPKVIIPVKPGRNIAVIIEVAAMQERLKKMGYSSSVEFEKNVFKEMRRGEIERK